MQADLETGGETCLQSTSFFYTHIGHVNSKHMRVQQLEAGILWYHSSWSARKILFLEENLEFWFKKMKLEYCRKQTLEEDFIHLSDPSKSLEEAVVSKH